MFALRYDGVDLGVLAQVFASINPDELTAAVAAQRTSKYLRRLWFFYEWLTGKRLSLPNSETVNYVDALDPNEYATGPSRRSVRHHVNDNLLGPREWCPMIRLSKRLKALVAEPIAQQMAQTLKRWQPEEIRRAVQYLYTKETRSSFSIEHEEVRGTREQRFVELMHRAEDLKSLGKSELIELLAVVIDPRYFRGDYRDSMIWVGETMGPREIFHYIPPRPEDVAGMMAALIDIMARLVAPRASKAQPAHPVVVAALVAFSFVYIHPFDDGNGRIHRFLIHYVLSRMGFTPHGLIIPVSAAILRDPRGYDAVLEDISREVMARLRYYFDENRRELVVEGDTAQIYRYLDLTASVEGLFGWVKQSIEQDLVNEIEYLRGMDRARQRMRLVLEMPDNLERLFVQLCHSNRYTLSKTKRRRFFDSLNDAEVTALEEAVRLGFAALPDDDDESPAEA